MKKQDKFAIKESLEVVSESPKVLKMGKGVILSKEKLIELKNILNSMDL